MRYIEENEIYTLVEPHGVAKVHCSQIDVLPRADVVPKSEVEQLQRKYDFAVAEREANVKGFTEELSKAKGEVDKLETEVKRLRGILLQFTDIVHKWGAKNNIDTSEISLVPILQEEADSIIKKANQELASEIFEEIQKSIVHNILHNESYSFEGVIDCITKDLDELKKKYTEQCPDCKHFVGCEEAVWSGRCEDFDSVRKEDEAYEKGYNDALKDVEEMILERKNENTPKT